MKVLIIIIFILTLFNFSGVLDCVIRLQRLEMLFAKLASLTEIYDQEMRRIREYVDKNTKSDRK